MSAPAGQCRICSGPLELRYPRHAGRTRRPRASRPPTTAPASTATSTSAASARTVQQPSLPGGDALHELYREMSDDDYLAEEDGPARDGAAAARPDRPATCRPGALLDVGCGHGLLLDEARKRGYEAAGLELSADAAGTPARCSGSTCTRCRSSASPPASPAAST